MYNDSAYVLDMPSTVCDDDDDDVDDARVCSTFVSMHPDHIFLISPHSKMNVIVTL